MPLFLLLWLCLPGSVQAQVPDTHRAGLVLVHGDGRVVTRCVAFSEERITGLDVLRRSGLSVGFSSGPMGATLCALDGEGCPTTDCFCQCKASPCIYWTYYHRNTDGSWRYSGVGAATWSLADGDVDGWIWGDGSAVPPVLDFESICASNLAVTAEPSPSPIPTATPTLPTSPSSTPVPQATATDLPSATETSIPSPFPTTVAETSTPTPTATESPSPTPSPAATLEASFETEAPADPTPPGKVGDPPVDSVASPRWASYGVFGMLVLLLIGLYRWRRR